MGLRRIHDSGDRDPLDAVWPSHIRLLPRHAEVGDLFASSYAVVGYPREVQPGWFEPLIGFREPITVVVRSAPIEMREVVKSLNRRMIWQRGALDADRSQGRLGRAEDSVALEDAEVVRKDLARGTARMMEVGITITVWASTLEELERNGRLLESLAQGMMMALRPLRYQQVIGLRRLLPLGEPMDKVREMDSRAWATVFPLSSRDVVHPGGQVLGINPVSHSLVVVDRFQMASPHSITIGWSGAGKSFFSKLEVIRARYRCLPVTIVDPEGEYRWMANLGAKLWSIGGPGERHAFPYDPFEIARDEERDEMERQCDFLIRLLERLSPPLMDEFGSAIHDVIWRQASGTPRFSPDRAVRLTIEELLEQLGQENRRAAERLSVVWSRWRHSVGSPPDTPHGEPFEVFDFSRVSEGMKGPVYLALTEWVMRRMGRESGRRLVVFDESWRLLTDDKTAPYLEELFRRARKWQTALSLVSQDIGDFVRNRAAEVCLRNAPMVLLLRQHPESVAEVTELLRLHEGEVEMVASAGPGEGLLILADDHVPLKVIASPREVLLLENGGVN